MFIFKGADAADTRAKYNGKPFWLYRALYPAFLCRLLSSRNGKLSVTVCAEHIIYL